MTKLCVILRLDDMNRTSQLGGKGTPRRKMVKKPTAAPAAADDKKLLASLGKMNVQQIQAIDQVSLIQDYIII